MLQASLNKLHGGDVFPMSELGKPETCLNKRIPRRVIRGASRLCVPPDGQGKIKRAEDLPGITFCKAARYQASLLLFVLLVVSTGCSFITREAVMYHAFEYPLPQRNNDSGAMSNDTLMVYRFLLVSSVDPYALVISEPGVKDSPVSLHQWKDNPADMVTELLLRDLERSGLFRKTVDQMSAARYRYALEGTIRSLQGLVSDNKAKGLLEVEVSLIDFEAPFGVRKYLLRKSYRVEIPSVDTQPDSIVKALNMAVREFSQQLRQDIGFALKQQAERTSPSEEQKAPKPAPVRSLSG